MSDKAIRKQSGTVSAGSSTHFIIFHHMNVFMPSSVLPTA